MSGSNDLAEIRFTNPILIDIFSHYASNSDMAAFVSQSGEIDMRFRLNGCEDPPKTCEQVLSLFYALLESNPESPAGRVFMAHQTAVLRETVYRLTQVIDGFSSVHITFFTSAPDGSSAPVRRVEYTITRKKTVQ